MDEATYRETVAAAGYNEPEILIREANATNGSEPHTHDFGASVLVLEGEITVTTPDGPTTCRAGDTFSLGANIEHTETIGPDGLRMLIARKPA
ncbi:MAG: cupin [Alphaproteobacteria bacterium]|jgi:quercetin dioxygenase-like cupin family protein|nr:cupin [Alphaproteobacteria bacterium]